MKKKEFVEMWRGKQNCIQPFKTHAIANVAWLSNPWRIVSPLANWDTASNRNYAPIASFHTREELWDYIKVL